MPDMPEEKLTEAYMVQHEGRVLCFSFLCGASKRNKVCCAPHMTQSPAYAEMSACMVYGCQDANKHAQLPAYAEMPAYMMHAGAHSSMK
jgi:hypothetical protein